MSAIAVKCWWLWVTGATDECPYCFLWTSPVLPVSTLLPSTGSTLPASTCIVNKSHKYSQTLPLLCTGERTDKSLDKHYHKSISFFWGGGGSPLYPTSISLYDYFVFTWEIHTTPQFFSMINVIIFSLLIKILWRCRPLSPRGSWNHLYTVNVSIKIEVLSET